MIWRCSSESWIVAWRSSSPRSFSCKVDSGSFAGSATVASIVSSSAGSVRRRPAESALKRAMDISHVDTEERALELIRLLPHVEEDLAQKVFGRSLVSDKAKEPAIHGGAVPREERVHGE